MGRAAGQAPLATHFQPIVVDIRTTEAERIGLPLLTTTRAMPLPLGTSPSSNGGPPTSAVTEGQTKELADTIARLQKMVAGAAVYVDNVAAEVLLEDPAVGRYLTDTLAGVPKLGGGSLEEGFNAGVQDALTAMYVANLTRLQVALADRLQTPAVLAQQAAS